MNKEEYWKIQAEASRAIALEERIKLQAGASRAVPQEELARMQLEATLRGDYSNLYPPTVEKPGALK